jgi:hypothetical protein
MVELAKEQLVDAARGEGADDVALVRRESHRIAKTFWGDSACKRKSKEGKKKWMERLLAMEVAATKEGVRWRRDWER